MIDADLLLSDLKRLLRELEDDLRARCDEHPEIDTPLRDDYRAAREADRTGQPYEVWRDEQLTQVAAAWVLACVFVRFMEDHGLLDEGPRSTARPVAYLSGLGERRQHALDRRTAFFREKPTASDRDYLLHVFEAVAELPGAREVLDPRHNPLWTLGPTGDGAAALLELFHRIEPDTGVLRHDFTDPAWDTRFLGDLYQDLSEAAQKRYALLQTPDFVEAFILDRTLEPAIQEFGFREVRLIDPACGSGHFLLGAFARLAGRWNADAPGMNPRERVQRVLDQIAGVDINPFAVAIARFRLLLAALREAAETRLRSAPDFRLHVAAGDSLLHGPRPGDQGARQEYLDPEEDPLRHVYHTEDRKELRRLLGRQYHVVVGNPPYITPKDKAQNEAYRNRFDSCHRQYALAVPFMERFFDLAIAPERGRTDPAGFVGTITANSFMKREFGKKLIEKFIPRWDLTHVIDTSGAYIPGHGTPTVILLGRHRRATDDTIRGVMGVRGEPSTPNDPAQGQVWSAICKQVDLPGSESVFVTVADLKRERFHKHPWSIGGGGASELKQILDEAASVSLASLIDSIGYVCITKQDEVFAQPWIVFIRSGVDEFHLRPFGVGEDVRDWSVEPGEWVIFPYDDCVRTLAAEQMPSAIKFMWPYRSPLSDRKVFGGASYREASKPWYEYGQIPTHRFRTPLSIVFAFVATHNHFVLDRSGKVFKQSAPVIKLPPGASEEEHLGLLGLLNSSTACFWMKQVFHNKGDSTDSRGARITAEDGFANSYEHDGTKLQRFPLTSERPLELSRGLDKLARERADVLPEMLLAQATPNGDVLRNACERAQECRERLIALQEELDWRVYRLYGLLEEDLCAETDQVPRVRLGQRAFEIVLARKLAAGEVETKWFERHGSTPITDLPAHWPAAYRALVERRIAAIESDRNIALIEQPEYKRRWNDEPWEAQEERALRAWLLDRLEDRSLWKEPVLQSTARLADRVREDTELMQVAELYRGRADFDLARLVEELVVEESVPLQSALRYKPSGLRKRRQWEATWELQRREDAIDARTELPEDHPDRLSEAEARTLKALQVGEIPVPPKYKSADFQRPSYWRLRGKLDVPKERFVSLPGAEREADPSPVVGWAGWTALEQAQAVAAYYEDRREREGWPAERLVPLLVALLELVPWLKQWHNELDPEHRVRMGDYFADFVEAEGRRLGRTLEELRGWEPPAKSRRRRARRGTSRS